MTAFAVAARVRDLQAAAWAHPLARATDELAIAWIAPDASLALSVNA